MDATEIHAPGNQMQIFLLDDHEMIRRGVRQLLEAEPDMKVVGEAGTCAEAMVRVPELQPHVAVLDVRLPDGDGISVCRELRSLMPELACVMLTSFDDDTALLEAVMAGASGYVLKEVEGANLINAVRTVASGKSLLDPSMTQDLLERVSHQRETADTKEGGTQLGWRERQILQLVGEGRTNRQIGKELSLSEKAVKDHVSGMLEKLGFDPGLARASRWYKR
ncbi:response regulator [Streptacidiphilus sp. EB129]|uniref:response regulator n=1 Tax=Streptacidiphilus sp. EB129 TaxID=3156262 RepID=UPI003516DBFD